MNKAWEIFRREYVERVRKKSFLILTLIAPLLLAVIGVVPNLLLMATPDVARPLAVVDLSGRIADQIEPLLNPEDDHLEDGSLRYPVRIVDPAGGSLEEIQEALNREVGNGSLRGYLVIGDDLSGRGQVSYYARNASNFKDVDALQDALSGVVVPLRFQDSGMDMDLEGIRALTRRIHVAPVQVGKSGDVEASGEAAQWVKLGAAYGMLLVFYMTILLWGISIMRGVVEEKSSRVVEVLLSSVSSRQLLAGKVLGIGAVALTQYLVWATTAVTGYYLLSSGWDVGDSLSTLSIWTVVAFLGYFVMGYLFYAAAYAALGACSTSDQDMQQFQQVGTIPAVVGFILSFYVFTNPDTTLATVLSMIPPFTPFVMIVRIAVLTPPTWEILASVAAMILGIGLMTILAAKIFRVGILMTGKKPTFREIFRWIRYA
jgi:ABC-2 type transport system permease protein